MVMKWLKENLANLSIKDEGYDSGYIGLDNNNPYIVGSKEYHLWDEGYKEAQDDLDSQESRWLRDDF